MAAILDFTLTPWLFCTNIVRNEFLISKYHKIEVLLMNVALQDHVLH